MGNRIVSEFAEQLRLSTLGSTLCSRSVAGTPAMVPVGQFPGVARAFVFFDGTRRTVGADCEIRRSFNVTRVSYQGAGQYRVEFPVNTFQATNYLTTGSIIRNSLTGADSFNIVYAQAGGAAPALTSIRIETFTTSITAVSSDRTTPRDCDGGNFLFFA